MRTRGGVDDVHVAHLDVAAALHGHAFGHARAVDGAAVKEVEITLTGCGVFLLGGAEGDHGFVAVPRGRGFEHSLVAELQSHCAVGFAACPDGVCHDVGAVGNIDGVIGVAVDDFLKPGAGVGAVGGEVGNDDFAHVGILGAGKCSYRGCADSDC